MKRTYLYILPIVCALWSAGCVEKTYIVPIEEDETEEDGELPETYKSYWYYTYEALDVIDYQTLGLEAAADFSPRTVAHRGDTLFVANNNTAGRSLILFDKKERRPLKTISSWNVGDAAKNFLSDIDAIFPTADRLYVSERSNMIHVFGLPDMDYITCIGTGSYNAAVSPVCNVQALTVKDGLIFARDKGGTVSIYKEADATPENYQKIKRYKQTGAGGDGMANKYFATHYMEVDSLGRILVTGYDAKLIRVLDSTLVTDDFTNGTNIDIDELTITVPFNPKTFAATPERLYVSGSNDAINIYDRESKEWIKTFKSVKGYTFTKAERIYGEDDETLWISDVTKLALVKMGIFKGEIREYETVGKNIVRVHAALTRSGEEAGEFYVYLRTHEIVDPTEVE